MINWVVDLNWHHTDLDPNRNNSENQSNDLQTLWPTHVSLVCSCPPLSLIHHKIDWNERFTGIFCFVITHNMLLFIRICEKAKASLMPRFGTVPCCVYGHMVSGWTHDLTYMGMRRAHRWLWLLPQIIQIPQTIQIVFYIIVRIWSLLVRREPPKLTRSQASHVCMASNTFPNSLDDWLYQWFPSSLHNSDAKRSDRKAHIFYWIIRIAAG